MSCPSCTSHILGTFLTRFNVAFPPTRIARNTTHFSSILNPGSSPRQPRRIPGRLIQRRRFQTASTQSPSLSRDLHNGALPLRQTTKPSHDDGGGFSGIGLVGQQSKDLQEQVSSIAAASEGPSSSKKGSQRTSPSTPARLARRARRMPSRRFKGDRARPETKEKTALEPASKKKDTKARQIQQVTSRRRETSPTRPESANQTFMRELEGEKQRTMPWGIQKKALEKKFGETGWMPRKRLSPDALEGIRTLHSKYPDTYTTPILAQHFKVSPENIRRILKSKWRPNEEEEEDRRRRWEKRGEGIWTEMAAKGVKPPKPWREKGIGRLSERRARSPSFATLEEQISKEYARDVVTTRLSSEHEAYGTSASTII